MPTEPQRPLAPSLVGEEHGLGANYAHPYDVSGVHFPRELQLGVTGIEAYKARASEFFKQFEGEGDEKWQKYLASIKPALEAFQFIVENPTPISPETLEQFKQLLAERYSQHKKGWPVGDANEIKWKLE